METPGQPDRGSIPSLYGECASGINHGLAPIGRRTLLAVALALPWAARSATEDPLLARAMDAMGGAALLRRVRALAWTGVAVVAEGDKQTPFGVDTRVEPFIGGRSLSWVAGQRDTTSRTVIVEPGGAFVERDGARMPLPPAEAEYERHRFGLYGYMLLAQAPAEISGGTTIIARRPGFPLARFDLDADARLEGGYYDVAAPDSGTNIGAQLIFQGRIADKGVSWPSTIMINEAGKPFRLLSIEKFAVQLA